PPSDSVPARFAACITEFEDRHFRWHPGVNPFAMVRAVRKNLRAGRVVSGGSTITMQVIRLSRERPRTVGEKLIEAVLATRLELQYSKKRILALYASHAPFGGNVVGLDAAAWRYFGHPAADLSWAEAATLAVLPNAPAMLHLARGRDALQAKRDRLLVRLLKNGTISEGTYQLAIEEPLPGEPLPLPTLAPHLVARMAAEHKGSYCVTTIDAVVQRAVENVLERWNDEFSRSDIRNLAAIVIDVQAGEVIAYCGNTGFEQGRSAGQVDVIRAPRSSGSILKPLLYCAMMQEGETLPRTLLPDIPVNINGFAPRNFSLRYDGAVPAAEALARSLNVPSVEMLRRYSVPKFHALLKKTGLRTITRPPDHYGLSLILGGAEVTLWDIASAYYLMARSFDGLDCPWPRILAGGEPVYTTIPFDRAAAWQTFEAIKEVNRPEEIDWRVIPSMQTIGWKTGTSYGLRDGWAVGVTPRYVVGVWAGNSNGEGKTGLTGASTAGPVMFDLFNILPAGRWFACPEDDMTPARVCRQSGMLAGRFCPDADTLLICPAGVRTEACPYHIQVNLTADEKWRINVTDEGAGGMVTRNWFVLPPAWEWYYRSGHPSYRPLPPWRAGQDGGRTPLQFIYPQPGARITLTRQGGVTAPLVMRAAHTYSRETLYWHMDGEYLGTTVDFHQWALAPAAGRHTVTIVDGGGNSQSVTFLVE
ncbi:MAG: penicillin-binding protein 1C, partial [Rikenellaceae bacterium]|nr:penicillin-binding protein 1C [Rikenellaceae bacterium]